MPKFETFWEPLEMLFFVTVISWASINFSFQILAIRYSIINQSQETTILDICKLAHHSKPQMMKEQLA